jgi:hypothetical protein
MSMPLPMRLQEAELPGLMACREPAERKVQTVRQARVAANSHSADGRIYVVLQCPRLSSILVM